MRTDRTFRPWTPPLALACAAAVYWACRGRAAVLAWPAGLFLLAAAPGLPLAYLGARRRRVRLFDFAAAAFVWGALALTLLVAAARPFAGRLTPALLPGLMLAASAVGLALARRRVGRTRIVKPAGATAAWSLLGAAAVAAAALASQGFRLVDENRYWPQDLYARAAAMNFQDALAGAEMVFEDARGRRRGPMWRVAAPGGALLIRNPSSRPVEGVVRLLAETYGEGRLRIQPPGAARPFELYIQPRFRLREHPRNYPPPNFLVEFRVRAAPGWTRIPFALAPWPRADHAARAVVTNVTTRSRQAFWRRLRARYLVANTGDTREQLCLARSLFDKPFVFSYSFNGTVFDGGGYTISNLPAPYFLYAYALLLLGDSAKSLHALYLAELAALYLALAALLRVRLRDNRGPAQWVALGPCLAYAAIMRFMVESLYVHTLLTLFVLVGVCLWRRGRTAGWAGYALLALLTKGGAVVVGLLAGLALAFRPRGPRPARSFAIAALAAAGAAGAALVAVGLATGSLAAWARLAQGTDYAGRFKLLAGLLHGQRAAAETLGCAAGDLTARVALACGLLPVWLAFRRGRLEGWLFASGAAFHLVVCASDVVWRRFGVDVHPLNYFTPAAVLWAAAGGRAALRMRSRPALLLAGAVGLACAAGAWRYVKGYERYFLAPGLAQREDFALSLNDYLLRRGAAAARRGERALAEAFLAEATRPRRAYPIEPTPRMCIQAATAHYLLARLRLAQGEAAGARAEAQAALRVWPRYAPARALLETLQKRR